ncbi:helicase associated domain-containing protein [Curtobacterium sp. APC 4022]|uniref:helicase associated domain-containing protein n=1 Tax=Curtobacterium sp. APC 4022 TaxID=3035201 RepID=UPI0025B4B4AF|nr:helicase associated domain-containing protein [Curtobacterium sp. APC 4022]MDN3477974.1 helicase associated domain-containing protein [Curtobacterium sp. APC 4022]
MPEHNSALEQLHAQWSEIAALPAAELTSDQRRGVNFYLADIQQGDSAEPHVRRWITMIHELDGFITSHGRLPLASAERPRPRTSEQRLVDQLAYQRRPSTRAAMVEYQCARLEALPRFEWEPQNERWAAWLEQHQAFWEREQRPPRRRATDHAEASIARWVAHQRASQRRGTLPADRSRRLLAVKFRVL